METQVKEKKKKTLRIVLIAVASFLVIAVITGVIFYNNILNNINRYDETTPTMSSEEMEAYLSTMEGVELDPTAPIVTDPSEFDVMTDDEDLIGGEIINIMLVGQDTLVEGYRGLSDTMILISINRNTKKMVITSFMRDLYIDIVGVGGSGLYRDRLNTAYCTGGIDQLGDTLAYNFGVEIDNFVEVDFTAFETIVDALGGVDIEITENEQIYLFYEIGYALEVGMNHLNGEQALEYSRIRKIDSDFYRTQRQRNVINALFEKVKNMSLNELTKLAEDFLPLVTTDMSNMDITKYIVQVAPILAELEVETLRIPMDNTWGSLNAGTEETPKYVIVCYDLTTNRDAIRTAIGE